jgi:hypothetical protein
MTTHRPNSAKPVQGADGRKEKKEDNAKFFESHVDNTFPFALLAWPNVVNYQSYAFSRACVTSSQLLISFLAELENHTFCD